MRYKIETTTLFKRQLKLAKKRGRNLQKMLDVIDILADGGELDLRCRNHKLSATPRFQNCWECHIEPDWLLVYRREEGGLVLVLAETGTHSDLFGK